MNYIDVYKMMKTAADSPVTTKPAKLWTYKPQATEYPFMNDALEIIHGMESNFGVGPITNTKSKAFGPYQITPATYTDAIGWNKDLSADGKTFNSLGSAKNSDYDRAVAKAILDKRTKMFFSQYNRWPYMEEALAMYNGGYNGRERAHAKSYAKDATDIKFWNKKSKTPAWISTRAKQPATAKVTK